MLANPKLNPRILFGSLLFLSLVASWFVYGNLKGPEGETLLLRPKLIGVDSEALASLPPAGSQQAIREAIAWDYCFIALYVFNLWIGLRFLDMFVARWTFAVPRWAFWLPPAAGLLDLVENRRLLVVLDGTGGPTTAVTVTVAAAANALAVALVVGVVLWVLHRVAEARWELKWSLPKPSEPESPADFETVLDAEREAIGERSSRRTVGLAFSGGGIRSATFNLGILQALADVQLLRRIHYLSTVSGGGYIGAWLTQWMRRDEEASPRARRRRVEKALRCEPTQANPEPDPILHLRSYSNYLTPRPGLLSADTWATIATYLRNLLLNLVIIVALVGVILLVPRAVVDWLEFLKWEVFAGTGLEVLEVRCFGVEFNLRHAWSVAAAAALALTSIVAMGINLAGAMTRRSQSGDQLTSQGAVQATVVLPLVAASIFASYWLASIGVGRRFVLWMAASALIYAAAWSLSTMLALRTVLAEDREVLDLFGKFSWWVFTALVAGAGSGAALGALTHAFASWSLWQLVTLGPPCVLMLFITTAVLHVGLMGRGFEDHLREWLARCGAWLMIYSLGWLALTGTAFYASVAVAQMETLTRTAIASGWLATSIAGVLAGRAQEQGGAKPWQRPLILVAPWVFIVGLVGLLSTALDSLLSRETAAWAAFRGERELPLSDLLARHDLVLDQQLADGAFWLWLFVLVGVAGLFAWRVAINEFSMHHYYRNRLVRAYLGASNRRRQENPFTGFDPGDDSCLGIRFDPDDPDTDEKEAPQLPLQLIGTALNIVHGERLGWQERKAASFIFSPLFSGFGLPAEAADSAPSEAYRPSLEVRKLTLGTAMAISGAAASPNMGFRSTPALTLLLAVFNVRLGWWLGNPLHPRPWRRGGPGFALRPLVSELFGLTSDTSKHVYLSDGGHFENLGLYELVRRRCRFIVVCDAAADPDLEFADLGNAIRKCRTDFGAEIDLDVRTLRRGEDGLSRRHCAVGRVRYAPESPGGRAETGLLLYIKASITGDEPEDVSQYAKRHPDFPHQSTADQFFDESQFESYRTLGRHIGNRVFRSASDHLGNNFHGWEILFRELHERWFAPSAAVEVSFSRHGESLDRIFQRLGDGEDLGFLNRQVYPEWEILARQARDTPSLPDSEEELTRGFYLCSSLIQLMESVYLDLRMDDEHTHPDNRGWMNLFKQWVQSPMMQATWALSAGTYGSRFQTFCKRWLDLHHGWIELGSPLPEIDERLGGIERQAPKVGTRLRELVEAEDSGEFRYVWRPLDLTALRGKLELDVGFCVVEHHREHDRPRLLYFEVARHLRNTGLARRGIYALKAEHSGIRLIPESRRLPFDKRSWERFRDLFESALDAGRR